MESSLKEWLDRNDIDMYARREKMSKARKRFIADSGEKCSVKRFREGVHGHCEWYRSIKMRSGKPSPYLTPARWEKLKGSVNHFIEELQGRPIAECVVIVRSECPCSEVVLRGLPKRLHVWGSK